MKIEKKILENGMHILVCSNRTVPKVSAQLWYHVGSKHEVSGQKGLAHLLEHMLFKGTKQLSESDINLITHKLSGYCNAFTSYDFTGYLFDFPTQHWHTALDLFVDCMSNCTFQEDFLHSELKAVIQELKMYKDDYETTLLEELIMVIFPDHPYHYPIIGFKQDLWAINRKNLISFYQQYYQPNNATLVVTGDVEVKEVVEHAQKIFGDTKVTRQKPAYTTNYVPDIVAKSVTLYRDVQQPTVMLTWRIPGLQQKQNFSFDVIAWLLAAGQGSELHRLLVDQLQLVSDVHSFTYALFEHGLFIIQFNPFEINDIQKIVTLIQQKIDDLIKNGIEQKDMQRAYKKAQLAHLQQFETTQELASVIGEFYMATQDETYPFSYTTESIEQVNQDVSCHLKNYLRPSIMHVGKVLPIEQQEKQRWCLLQQESDALDNKFLCTRERITTVESGKLVHEIKKKEPAPFSFAAAKETVLNNGLKVLWHHRPGNMIEVVLQLKADHTYDPVGKSGLFSFVCELLLEGTKNYTKQQLLQIIEGNGMEIDIQPGFISIKALSQDLSKAMQIMHELITNARFDKNAIEKVRKQLISDIKDYWDDPSSFVAQLAKQQVYKEHPYGKNILGTVESIDQVSRDDIVSFYNRYFTPQEAHIAIVGDIQIEIPILMQQTIGHWTGEIIKPRDMGVIKHAAQSITHQINRDQIILAWAGVSIKRTDSEYDTLLLFEQILSGGSSASMSSRLFMLREQTGLFYTIKALLTTNAHDQPGMIFVKTIVSKENLAQAQQLIEKTLLESAKITDQELDDAKSALIHQLFDNFETNKQVAYALLFACRYNLPHDFWQQRIEKIKKISKEEIQNVAQKYLTKKNLSTIKIGRLK